MEGQTDPGQQSGMERSIRYDHLRTWITGTSARSKASSPRPVMTRLIRSGDAGRT
jgi:hypothetical protein